MIRSIKFIEGFAVEDVYKNVREMKFTDGINFLFGANGVGKSVAIKFMKAYCSIPKEGWTSLVDPKVLAPDPFPHAYRAFTPEKDRVIVDWDGTLSFYNSGDISNSNAWFYQNTQAEDGFSSHKDLFDMMVEKPSSGQHRIKKLNKIFNIIKTPPDLRSQLDVGLGKDVKFQYDYITSLPRNGKNTLLLDEPERSLSLPKQKKLLEVLLELSKDYQIIAACHSPFVLSLPRDKINLIEIDKGYVDECDKLFNFKQDNNFKQLEMDL